MSARVYVRRGSKGPEIRRKRKYSLDSDIDIRGCAFNSKADLLGMSNFEQVLDNPTDTVIYGFNKLVGLLVHMNPDTIELLDALPP